jgi:hypothetical protein
MDWVYTKKTNFFNLQIHEIFFMLLYNFPFIMPVDGIALCWFMVFVLSDLTWWVIRKTVDRDKPVLLPYRKIKKRK